MKPPTNPKRTLIESLQVGLAWDSQIKEWAERELPNGEVVGRVKNAQTVNYKTLKPVKDGLFCEKIFGPTKDFECACGFKQTRGGFCPQCNVEFTRSEVRRYRLGYFQLPSAVTHVWYLRGRPSYISYLLGIKIKKALALTYGAASLLVNSQNEKVMSQEESESLTFSFTTQTLYPVGKCKGKTVPRSQIRRYNPNHFLFDKKRAKLIKNLFHSFVYASRPKIPPSVFASYSVDKNVQKQNKLNFHSLGKSTLPKFVLPLSGAVQKTNLQDFYKEKKDLKTSLLSTKQHDSSMRSSYITRPFFFSSTIRGGWQPLIVVNLQEKLPISLLYKKEHPKYYKFKKYLKFSQNMGFYTPFTFAKQKQNDTVCKEDASLLSFNEIKSKGTEGAAYFAEQSKASSKKEPTFERNPRNEVFEKSFFTKQNQAENVSLVKINRLGETVGLSNINGLSNTKHGDKNIITANFASQEGTNHGSEINDPLNTGAKSRIFAQGANQDTLYQAAGYEKRTKFFSNRFISLNKKKKVKKLIVGIDKNKESKVSTLIFYPIKKEINKVQKKENLIRNSPSSNEVRTQISEGNPEQPKKFYQELDSKFKSLNYVEKTTKQVGFSFISEKKLNLQEKFKETKSVFEHSIPQNVKLNGKNQSFALNREELTDFRSLFHFIGQPCQLKRKSRFLVHTASSFSQTRNHIFKILEKEKSINSIDFGNKLSHYDENLKDKYRILNNNVKKQYHQNHLFPYLFCLSCQSKNYQYLQTYSNFFVPILSNSEKTLLISSYKNQTKKNQFLNLYDSFLKNKFIIANLLSCFDNSLTVGLKDLTNALAMHSSDDYFAEKNVIEGIENPVEQNINNSIKETYGKQNELKLDDTLQLPNSNSLRNSSTTYDQLDSIFGEIPLVLDLCQNRPRHGGKNSEFGVFAKQKQEQKQKKEASQKVRSTGLQNKISPFWKLKKKTKLLQDKNLETEYFVPQNVIGRNLQNKLSQNKSKAISTYQVRRPKKMLSFGARESGKIERKERESLFTPNLNLQRKCLSKILLKLNKGSPLFLQNISINSFFNSSKNQSFIRGLLIKRLFFIEAKSQFLKNDVFLKQKQRETLQPILPLYSAEGTIFVQSAKHGGFATIAAGLASQEGANHEWKRFQKIDLFKSFAEQNFPPRWKPRQQIKKILKTANILKNFRKITLSPIPTIEWSYLSKKPNKEDYLFSIYEISVQQALGYTCGEAILKILSPINCYQLESGLKVVLWQINERISEVEDQGFLLKSDIILLNSLRTKKSRTLRRLKIAKILRKTKVLPKQMVFSLLPVLPPSLRPIIQLDENIVAVSDCSQIYQKIVQRSNRLSKRMSKYLSYDHCLRLKVLLQQAVDGLIENGKGGSKPLCDNNGRPLKSLSDGLKGKKGRFRQDLLGRRVDYSGRSVIVVGPALKLHQCGLPREMAIELFQPFLIRQLFAKKIVSNIAVAKNYIKKETPIVLEILKQLLRSHPVLLNRAPTLHRLGVQAFQPKLVSGRAILLHPLVCSAFNADFDGDQMAVHIPLSSKARGEAWKILWSRNNILSPATGQPILVPSQDMVLGCYYLTTKKANFLTKKYFGTEKEDIKKQSLIYSTRVFENVNKNLQSQLDNANILSEPNVLHTRITHENDHTVVDVFSETKNKETKSEKPNHFVEQNIFSFKTDFGKEQLDREAWVSPRKNLETSIRKNKWTGFFFNNSYQVLRDLQQKRLKLHTSIWLKMDCDVEIHKEEQKPLEARINCCGNFTKIYPGYLRKFYKKEGLFFNENKLKKSEDFYVRTTCGRVMLNQTISPISYQPF